MTRQHYDDGDTRAVKQEIKEKKVVRDQLKVQCDQLKCTHHEKMGDLGMAKLLKQTQNETD